MGEHYITANSTPVPESGCWLWTLGWSAKGYGATKYGGFNYAHRASFAAFVGPIPDGMMVCHKCDTRACVNPDHLFLGTPKDNIADASRKGRMHPGTSNYNSKLTPDVVRQIRSTKGRVSAREWARRTGTSHATVAMARRGDTWRDA